MAGAGEGSINNNATGGGMPGTSASGKPPAMPKAAALNEALTSPGPVAGWWRVLIVSERRSFRERVGDRLKGHTAKLVRVATSSEAVAAASREPFDAALVDAGSMTGRVRVNGVEAASPDAFDVCSGLCAACPGMAVLVVHPEPTLAGAMRAMHAGAVDLMPGRFTREELLRRVGAAVNRRRSAMTAMPGAAGASNTGGPTVGDLCRRMDAAREKLATEAWALRELLTRIALTDNAAGMITPGSAGAIPDDAYHATTPDRSPADTDHAEGRGDVNPLRLTDDPRPPSADVGGSGIAGGQLRDGGTRPAGGRGIASLVARLDQELDLENALRTLLEWLHAELGPANAAVFLPTELGDWSLGAYINHDVASGSAEAAMDQIAACVGPEVEARGELVWTLEAEELPSLAGESAAWLGDAELLACPCWDMGRCRAVLAAFRTRPLGFTEDQAASLVAASRVFGQRMSRILRVHHRRRLIDDSDEWRGGLAA